MFIIYTFSLSVGLSLRCLSVHYTNAASGDINSDISRFLSVCVYRSSLP